MHHPIPRGLRAAAAVAVAELRRTLRDPHVAAYLLAPIALYPMLVWGGIQLGLYEEGRREREPIRVEVSGPAALVDALSEAPFTPATGGLPALEGGELDVLVQASAQGEAWHAELHHTSTRARSRRGLDEVRQALSELRAERLAALAADARVDTALLAGARIHEEPVNGVEAFVASVVAVLIGYIAAFAMLLSSIYPAIDVVVAERERGTLETLLLAAVPRWALLLGKALSCTTLVALAALGNMASLALTMAHLRALVFEDLDLRAGLAPEPWMLIAALPVLVSTALLVSSLAIAVVLPARTFKEGEMIATSAVMVGFLPGVAAVIALIAGETTGLLALPFANLIVVLHRALTGELAAWMVLGPTLENTLLAAVALAGAAALAGREDFLIGGRLPRWLRWMHRSEAS